MLGQGGQHGIPPLAIEVPHMVQVFVQRPPLTEFMDRSLDQSTAMEIGQLLDLAQPFDHRSGGSHPAQPQAGEEDFGKGAQVDDIPILIQSQQWGRSLVGVIEFTVGVVFDDGHPMAAGQLQQAQASPGGHGAS